MKTLTLPGAWAQVWKRTREVLHDIGRTADRTEPIEPRIGGGTALAARWKHRASIDIDVLLPGRETLVDLTWDDEMNLAERRPVRNQGPDLRASARREAVGGHHPDLAPRRDWKKLASRRVDALG